MAENQSYWSLRNFQARGAGRLVYKWFAQLCLVFCCKPRTYHCDEDKVAFALFYMTGVAQNWAMLILQALDEGHHHDLLVDYNCFWEAVSAVYGDKDHRIKVIETIALKK